MTEFASPPEASDDADLPIPLSDSLISFIVAMLAPLFLGAGSMDVRLARMAALETLSAYRVQNQADLMTVAQIVAFGVATLGSLSQSMLEDLSLPMVLRLRSNANALSRSGHRHQQSLAESHRAFRLQPAPATEVAQQVESLLASHAAAPAPHAQEPAGESPPETGAEQALALDAPVADLADAAPPAGCATPARPSPDLPGLPAAERRPPTMRAAALASTASELLTQVQGCPIPEFWRTPVSLPEAVPTQASPPIPRSAPLPR